MNRGEKVTGWSENEYRKGGDCMKGKINEEGKCMKWEWMEEEKSLYDVGMNERGWRYEVKSVSVMKE